MNWTSMNDFDELSTDWQVPLRLFSVTQRPTLQKISTDAKKHTIIFSKISRLNWKKKFVAIRMIKSIICHLIILPIDVTSDMGTVPIKLADMIIVAVRLNRSRKETHGKRENSLLMLKYALFHCDLHVTIHLDVRKRWNQCVTFFLLITSSMWDEMINNGKKKKKKKKPSDWHSTSDENEYLDDFQCEKNRGDKLLEDIH